MTDESVVVKMYTEIARFPDIQGDDFVFVERWRGTAKDKLIVSANPFTNSIPQWGWIHGTKRGWFDISFDVPEMQFAVEQYFGGPEATPDVLLQWIWQQFTFSTL